MTDSVTLKTDHLKPGLQILAITSLSSEYSYLDAKRVGVLIERFKGSKVTVERNGNNKVIPVEELVSGDDLKSIQDIPPGLGFEKIDAAMAEYLSKNGFLEVKALDGVGEPPSESVETPQKEHGPRAKTNDIPVFRSQKSFQRMKRLAEVKYFMEQVEDGSKERNNANEMLQELFEQGRAGKYSVQPAVEAVEKILQKDLSRAMTAVAGLRGSDQTYAHCVDMAVIFNEAAQGMVRGGASGSTNQMVARSTMAAGFMHDIGKSKLPREILDSTERFAMDSHEMELMRSHVTHSAQILSDANMDDAMINVAHYHHVKKDTSLVSSYPKVEFSEVAQLTRLASIVDVYQALTGKRSYKKNWVPAKAVQYLYKLQGTEFDETMIKHFLKVIGRYPIGSLVKLSTGDMAFVTRVEDQPLDQPVVVLVENAKGELFSSNTLVDLTEELEITIVEVVDHYEHYNDHPDHAFDVFKSIRVV